MFTDLPDHLKRYVIDQDPARYTALDHAVWRYVMRQNQDFLRTHAHGSFIEGLAEAGINLDSIPVTAHMNRCLSRHGWRAVNVSGFIPPTAFLEFQARGILPIAIDVRTAEHIAYTPAPDIIHEAAGHAPFLCNPAFSTFVRLLAELGSQAASHEEDLGLYEAIRHLSLVKEDPHASQEAIAGAEHRFERARSRMTRISPAASVSRLYWWTVEYGLIGTIEEPRIYGAGLLSSVGESQLCMTPAVRKLPFDLDACLATGYDITRYQPQLFVCSSFEQLVEAVRELARRMGYSFEGRRFQTPMPDLATGSMLTVADLEAPPLIQWTPAEIALHTRMARIRALRESTAEPQTLRHEIQGLTDALDRDHPLEWLARLELLELLTMWALEPEGQSRLRTQLHALRDGPDRARLIEEGIRLIDAVPVTGGHTRPDR